MFVNGIRLKSKATDKLELLTTMVSSLDKEIIEKVKTVELDWVSVDACVVPKISIHFK